MKQRQSVPLLIIVHLIALSACSTPIKTVEIENTMSPYELQGRATMGMCMVKYFELKLDEIKTNKITPQQAFVLCLSDPTDISIDKYPAVGLDYYKQGLFTMGACMVIFADIILFQPHLDRASAVYKECLNAKSLQI